ncbi:MAG: adenylosuccinate lyase [Ignisphaera sp.]|nr:adenylosuccinate lyase [Ignisphaera sp.]MDW8084740.1 adenylosuccinate lyase [Ignisphaera sp.]
MDGVCVFDWRYGSREVRELFASESIVRRYIDVEIALVKGLEEAGLAEKGCSEELRECMQSIAADEVYKREAVTGHDIASLAYIAGERCGRCGKYVHLGATSYDIVDTAWSLILREAIAIVRSRLRNIINRLTELSQRYRDTLMVGRTHGQHALPITLGFKLANYIYEFSRSFERLCEVERRVVLCKISGAVGTMAAWRGRGLVVEAATCRELGLEPYAITTQVAPRDGFAELVADLAILASQLDRFALEVRELSRTEIGELFEAGERIGSSTMPQKRNPVTAERVSGLAKIARALVTTALENIPLMHERDLTNSSSERILIPHALLTLDQMLIDMEKLLTILAVDEDAMRRNLEETRGAVMAEAVMVKLVEKGLHRHEAHRLLREIASSMGGGESFRDSILRNSLIMGVLSEDEINNLLNYRNYLGSYRELIERAIIYARNTLEKCEAQR